MIGNVRPIGTDMAICMYVCKKINVLNVKTIELIRKYEYVPCVLQKVLFFVYLILFLVFFLLFSFFEKVISNFVFEHNNKCILIRISIQINIVIKCFKNLAYIVMCWNFKV